MGQITHGEIRYGENIKTGDYAGKKAEAVFGFKVDNDEDAAVQAGKALGLAIAHVNQALGLKNTTALATATIAAPRAEAVASAPKSGKDDVAEKERQKAAKAAEKAEKARAELAAKKTTAADEVADVDEPTADISIEDEEPKAEPITDAALTDAVAKKNTEIANPVAIRALITKYAGDTPPIQMRKIPQDKRAEFLKDVAALKKA